MGTDRIEQARSAWTYRGRQRPPFAVAPEPGQESVWDYPRPPALEPERRTVEVRHGDRVLAQSSQAMRVCETGSPPTIYIPPADVDRTALVMSPARTFCEWKGEARYFRAEEDAPGAPDIAWCYPSPFPEFHTIQDWFCFYPGRVDCFLDREPVRAQAGGFYGGWITGEIVGPFKGDPGTGHW